MPGTDNVQVVVRCRPLFGKELGEGRQTIVEMDVLSGSVSLKHPKGHDGEKKKFTFDKIFGETNTQRDVYDGAASEIVNASIEGYNGTIFCYGQTGTGKTHTMEGKDFPEEERGILPHAFHHVFASIEKSAERNVESLVRASFLEIYNENVRDLLAKDQTKTCELKETSDKGVYVAGLTTFVVKSPAEMNNILQVGKKNRSVGATLMNADSSRSHSIFTVTVETSRVRQGDPPGAEPHITVGKLNLVDLAGSERQSKTHAVGDRLKEATKINLSLSALGNVISALVDGKSTHIPYRDSKLTRLLQDSLGGNTKTVMIANVGPADYNFDETMSTLRYANRAKNIKNKPKINEDPKDAMLREFQEEIKRLREQLANDGGGGGDGGYDRGNVSFRSQDGDGDALDDEHEVDPTEDQMEQLRREVAHELTAKMRDASGVSDLAKIKAEAETQMRLEMEKMILEKDMGYEEADRIRRAMEEQSVELELQLEEARLDRLARDDTERKLREMEGKLIHGVDALELRNQELQEIALAQEQQLELDARGNTEAQIKIDQLEELHTKKKNEFYVKKESVADVTKKLKKTFARYQGAKADLEAHARTLRLEKEDMVESINLLRRQLLLKDTLIDAFCPKDTAKKVEKFAAWEDETERWVLERISGRSQGGYGTTTRDVSKDFDPRFANRTESMDSQSVKNSSPDLSLKRNRERKAAGLRPTADPRALFPICDTTRVAVALGNRDPRLLSDNILKLPLDFAERTTFDLFGEEIGEDDDESTSRRDAANAARRGAQAVLDIAFSTEQPARLAPYSGETAVRGESSRRSVNSVDSRTVPQNSSKPVRPGSAKRR